MPGPLTVVFDLDGTLVDSQRDIVDSFLHGFDAVGLPRPAREEVIALVGRPLEEMYAAFAPSQHVDRLSSAYRAHYPLHFTDHTVPYAGVVELLEALGRRGYARVVATTKRTVMAEELVEAVGLRALLEHVQGTDGIPAKPAPDVIERALAAVGGDGVLMVGDTVGDVLAGKAAGLTTYAVTWGSGTPEALAAAGPDALEPNLDRLLELLGALEGA
jgi:phosphoglycolate phosphatase